MNHISTRQRTGLVLATLLNATAIPSVLIPTPDGELGPPLSVLVLSTLLGIVGVLAVVPAWRGGRAALRVVAGTIVLGTVVALPAFFVDVPAGLKAATGAAVLASLAALVLMFSTARHPVAAMDGRGLS